MAKVEQYAGYVTVDECAGRALYYFLVEAEHRPADKPLTLWLNGGPGCSSIGGGLFAELGPFWTNKTANGLIFNEHAWTRESNVLFLDSPAGVGFSYSNRTSDYTVGDAATAKDTYRFLHHWLRRFPIFSGREFYIAGESYAGHYVPQLAYVIWQEQQKHPRDALDINLKGFLVGNAWTDTINDNRGMVDFWFTRALISESTYLGLNANCEFTKAFNMDNHAQTVCANFSRMAAAEMGNIFKYDVYVDVCVEEDYDSETQTFLRHRGVLGDKRHGGVPDEYDPCEEKEVDRYLNRPEVQDAIHANLTGHLSYKWTDCAGPRLNYSLEAQAESMLPIYRQLIKAGMKIWVYSGDADGVVPVMGTRLWIRQLVHERILKRTSQWTPWYLKRQVGGYTEEFNDGRFVFATVRNAGHMVPYTQPSRSLELFRSFLLGRPIGAPAPPPPDSMLRQID
eukprot:SM000018S03654  [mRNA]  locus=s18:574394:578664:- [translate_table: standard]